MLRLLPLLLFAVPLRAADNEPAMKFNEVKEVTPGVFFRYSSISATDKNIPFGGSNNIWVVFEDYVAVVDANFPKEAECPSMLTSSSFRPTSRCGSGSPKPRLLREEVAPHHQDAPTAESPTEEPLNNLPETPTPLAPGVVIMLRGVCTF